MSENIPGGFKEYWWVPLSIWVEPGVRSHDIIDGVNYPIIPWWVDIYYFSDIIGAQLISTHDVVTGKGECTGISGFEPGPATFIVNQLGFINKDFKPNHPNTYPGEFWPVEIISIHQ
ncbi:MAG: hypothetical protein Lokiarch_36880 [Candidatus Lokiarchaeum sp. GC14_75]|nr:MAG: hypothetical protein Lokiarch_36880 [Candidatus Lokiarchaeum sp. GC14_75]